MVGWWRAMTTAATAAVASWWEASWFLFEYLGHGLAHVNSDCGVAGRHADACERKGWGKKGMTEWCLA